MNEEIQQMETGEPMKKLLKQAVVSQEVPANLEMKIRMAIRQGGPAPDRKGMNLWAWAIPSVTILALTAAALFMVLSNSSGRTAARNPDEYVASVGAKVSRLMRVGLGDHIHCAVFRKYPQTPPPVETMQRELGPKYAGMLNAVKANVPAKYRVQMAHQCRFAGRQFVHLVMKNEDRLVSVVVATKKDGEAFEADRLVPALERSGISFYQQNADAFQIAAYANAQHVVYVISNLPKGENMDMLLAMSRGINLALPQI